MKSLLFPLVLAFSLTQWESVQAQDWNVECNDGATGNVHFVGNDSHGAAIFWDTDYSISQSYDTLLVSNQNMTIYQGDGTAFLMVWHARNGNTYVWTYPVGQRNYLCQ